jgi:erythrocyte band 7 integral membrane protein
MYPIEVTDDDGTLVSQKRQENNDDNFAGDCCGVVVLVLSIILIIVTFPISIFMCIRVIQEYERAVIFRLGRVMTNSSVGPGIFLVVPCTDEVSFCSKIRKNA